MAALSGDDAACAEMAAWDRSGCARTVEVSGQLPDLYRLPGVFLRVATALTNQPPYC